MLNILYVHGFASNQNSRSFTELKSSFLNHNFFASDFDLLDVKGTLKKIDTLCKEKNIDLIIGKSLGGFYTLAYEGFQNKIVINPCIKPWIEIPKLDSSVKESVLDEWKKIFEQTENSINKDHKKRTFGIFGDKDELFSYKNYFDKHYGAENNGKQKSFMIPGKHHIDSENLKIAVQKGLDYFNLE